MTCADVIIVSHFVEEGSRDGGGKEEGEFGTGAEKASDAGKSGQI
jgi:hypothetical protein